MKSFPSLNPSVRAFLSGSLIMASLAVEPGVAFADSALTCNQNAAYQSAMTILVIDRTTELTDRELAVFRAGMAAFFKDEIAGSKLVLWEVRDENSSLTRLRIPDDCLVPLQPALLSGEDRSGWRQWLPGQGPAPETNDDPEDAFKDRQDIFRDVMQVARRSISPTPKDTRLAVPLARLLQSQCAGRESCTLLVFSDLLDSEAKQAIGGRTSVKSNKLISENASQNAGMQRAKQLSVEYGLDRSLKSVTVVAWGTGRSDEPGAPDLSDAWRRRIKAYWTGYFNVLIAGATGTHLVSVADDFVRPR